MLRRITATTIRSVTVSVDDRLLSLKPAFHDTDTGILADTSDTRDFPKLFLWQAERGSRRTRRHPRDDPREDVGVDVGVGVVECGLYRLPVKSPPDFRRRLSRSAR